MGLLRALFRLVLVLVIIVVGLLGWITARALPQTSGVVRAPDLHAPVTVIRDAAGIAHLYADDPHDLFFGQGYVHAQERLWQMEVWRHIGAGRLSELFGASSVDTDTFLRTLGWRSSAETDLAAASDDVRAALEAYAAGVNAYIDEHAGALGLAFVVTGVQGGLGGGLGGYEPEPWTPLDSMTWQKVQAWNLGGNLDAEIFRLLADAQLGDPARTDELYPAYDPSRPVITPSGLDGSGGAGSARGTSNTTATASTASTSTTSTSPVSRSPVRLDPDERAGWRTLAGLGASFLALAGLDAGGGLASDHGIGSNNWVVTPELSTTGGALLANDPHLGFNMPSVWFMNGLHCRTIDEACPFDVVGVSFPGAPAVILGHNARIAWGATNAGPDVMDLFAETVDPANPDAYLYGGRSMPFETRTETIVVAGGSTETITIRSSVHGPILSDVDDRLRDGPPVALSWTTLIEPDGAFESIYRLNLAQNFDDFRNAFRTWGAPSQNFVYADVDGHIGYQLPGKIPIRVGQPTGDRIRHSSDGSEDWVGWIPFDDLPWQLDPAPGMVVSANNAAVDGGFPHYIAADWDRGERAARIVELLGLAAESGGVTLEEMGEIQNDVLLLRSEGILTPLLELAEPATSDGRLLKERIARWDHECDVDSVGCAAFAPIELALTRAIFDDDLGDLARDWVGSGESGQVLQRLLVQTDSTWWDDIDTPAVETATHVVSATFDRVGADLRAALAAPDTWTWGRLHAVTFREATLGISGISPLEWYFNAGARPAPGAAGAVDNNYYQLWRAYDDPYDETDVPVGLGETFAVSNGPSYRLLIDMSDLDAARIVITTGQSGNPFDGHYGDLIDDWLAGDTVALPFSEGAVQAAAVSTLTLRP